MPGTRRCATRCWMRSRAVRQDDGIEALVFTGAGERAFSAGQDINESNDFDEDPRRTLDQRVPRALFERAFAREAGRRGGQRRGGGIGVPVRAADRCSGLAMPARAWASRRSIRASPSITGPWIMREILGLSRTIEMTLTGRMAPAEEALQLGLLHHIVAREEVLVRAQAIARELADKPAIALRLIKRPVLGGARAGFQGGVRRRHPLSPHVLRRRRTANRRP